MRDWEHRLLGSRSRGACVRPPRPAPRQPSVISASKVSVCDGPPPPGDAVERASEYIGRMTEGLPVVKPLSGEYVSIPVPPSPELIYKVAEAIRNAYADEIIKSGGAVPPGMDITDLCGTVTEWHAEAQAAVRALREAQ